MSVTLAYAADQLETGTRSTRTVQYYVSDAADEDSAISQLQAERPSSRGALVVESDRVTERVGDDVWLCEVEYVLPEQATLSDPQRLDPPATGESRYEFQFGLTPAHITHSKATPGIYYTGDDANVVHDNAIGVQGSGQDMRIEGTDVQVPTFQFSETHYLPVATVTGSYKSTIGKVVGKVNNAPFKGFATGEVLCSSITGSQRNAEDWEITFSFAASENLTNLTIGSITGINKEGWQHLWVQYRQTFDDTANAIKMEAAAVYVEQIYDYANFATLGIGTT